MHLVLLPPHESGLFQGGSHCKDRGRRSPSCPSCWPSAWPQGRRGLARAGGGSGVCRMPPGDLWCPALQLHVRARRECVQPDRQHS